ncbi:MAG TPA: rod shape-determining protein RodA, partial [Gemmatimonas sp.]|nr:rod shape-determining protein RodA [Gemmatimonas sp.]
MGTALRRQGIDYPLLVIALLLSTFGIAMVFSAGQTDIPTFVLTAWKKQLAWFGVAIVVALTVMRGSVRLVEWSAWPLYVLSCLLLVTVLFTGTGAGTASSVKGWLTIGGTRIGQPAELAKLATTLMLARVLSAQREAPKSLLELWKPLLVVGIPWILIMLQPDLGTGIVFIGICFGMLYWSGVPWQLLLMLASPGLSLILAFSTGVWGAWFLVLVALVLWYRTYLYEGVILVVANVVTGVVAPSIWDRLDTYQQQRLLMFLVDPSTDAKGSGWNLTQSLVAIGSGGVFGKGFTLGSQKRGGFIPERQTDFIFSVVGEELGFIGVSVA